MQAEKRRQRRHARAHDADGCFDDTERVHGTEVPGGVGVIEEFDAIDEGEDAGGAGAGAGHEDGAHADFLARREGEVEEAGEGEDEEVDVADDVEAALRDGEDDGGGSASGDACCEPGAAGAGGPDEDLGAEEGGVDHGVRKDTGPDEVAHGFVGVEDVPVEHEEGQLNHEKGWGDDELDGVKFLRLVSREYIGSAGTMSLP